MSHRSDSGSKGSGSMKHYAEQFMLDFDLSTRVREILAAQPLNTVNPTSFHVNALGNPRVGEDDTCSINRVLGNPQRESRVLSAAQSAQAVLVSEAINNTVVDSNVTRR